MAWFQPTAEDRDEAAQQLDLLGVADLAERPFGVLSQGEKQKVLIARARMAEPMLLVLDEPCAGMDPGARENMLEALGSLLSQPDAPATVPGHPSCRGNNTSFFKDNSLVPGTNTGPWRHPQSRHKLIHSPMFTV